MKSTAFLPVFILTVPLVFAAQGTVPAKKVAEYRSHVEVDGNGLGASILNVAQTRQHFVSDLGNEYLVVEVGLYPKDGAELKVQPGQFVLHIVGQDRVLRSENPKVIAASLQKDEVAKRGIAIIPHAEVGYESGRRGYDPRTGTTSRTTGGIYTSTGMGVVVGEASPGSNPKNEDVMALELSEKGLPEGTFAKPVAGHLYFRVGKGTLKDKKARFDLGFEIDGKEGALALKR